MRFLSALRNIGHKARVEAELNEEINSCLSILAEKKMKEGLSEAEARRVAAIEMGGVEQVKEEVRASRAGFSLETFFMDLRHGMRSLAKTPAFTLTALIALALGIGANTAIFSVINGVLLRSLPYRDPQNIVTIWERFIQSGDRPNVISPANFLAWQKQNHAFEELAAAWDVRLNFTGNGEPLEVQAQRVTASFFRILAVQPEVGRWISDDEDRPGGNLVAVLSHELWQKRFGGNTAIVGQQTTISGRPYTIIGVMPPGFHFLNDHVQVWTPFQIDPAQNYRTQGHFARCAARLRSGVSVQQAQVELNGIAQRLEREYPDYNKGWSVSVVPIYERIVGEVRPVLLVLSAAVAFVLLIACANVANLLLARAAVRAKELALRAALGAGRLRLVRQMLTESVLLAVIGGAVGVLLAWWGIHGLVALAPDNIPRLNKIEIDPRVLGFTFVVSLVTGIIFGFVPALHASQPDLSDALKESARGSTAARSRALRNAFVVAEVSLALVLLMGAGLMIRSFFRLHQVKTGFISENVLTMRVQLPAAKYPDGHAREAFFSQLLGKVGVLPGVNSFGAINFLPLTGLASSTSFTIEGRPPPAPGEAPGTEVRLVAGEYFGTMGIPLIKGRLFDAHDGADSRVLIINATMAQRYFPGENPVGKRITINWEPKVTDEIIGVVGDIRETTLEREANPAVYWPHGRDAYPFMTLVLRTAMDPMQLASAVQKEIRALDPDQPVTDVRTLQQVVSKSIARPRFNTLLLGIFAGIALVLASVGLYGVMNYSATQRTQEIGIRIALGATRRDIMRLIVGNGMLFALIGIVIGILVSLAVTRVMQSLLFDIGATDAGTFVGVSALLILVASIANYLPARKATRLDPVAALRYE
jgi:putative ABC transport system permease protein